MKCDECGEVLEVGSKYYKGTLYENGKELDKNYCESCYKSTIRGDISLLSRMKITTEIVKESRSHY